MAHIFSKVVVNISDFKSAFATVGPSMQRGFQVQVEKMNWDDVGGLEDVKKVSITNQHEPCRFN